jgi:hypothetical protein
LSSVSQKRIEVNSQNIHIGDCEADKPLSFLHIIKGRGAHRGMHDDDLRGESMSLTWQSRAMMPVRQGNAIRVRTEALSKLV